MLKETLGLFITAHKRSLGQGNVFIGVCLCTDGVSFPACITGHMTSSQGGLPRGGGFCLKGVCLRGWVEQTPQPELEKWAVRILLECFLVPLLRLEDSF